MSSVNKKMERYQQGERVVMSHDWNLKEAGLRTRVQGSSLLENNRLRGSQEFLGRSMFQWRRSWRHSVWGYSRKIQGVGQKFQKILGHYRKGLGDRFAEGGGSSEGEQGMVGHRGGRVSYILQVDWWKQGWHMKTEHPDQTICLTAQGGGWGDIHPCPLHSPRDLRQQFPNIQLISLIINF